MLDLSRVRVVLGHSLGSLGNGMLGQLSGENEADGSLDLARGNGLPVVVASQTVSLNGKALEDIVDEESMTIIALREIPVSGWTCLRTL